MIFFNYQKPIKLDKPEELKHWINEVIVCENYKLGEINYIFCTDEYLSDINVKYLKHNTLTDIISFDYSIGHLLSGEIYISIDRIKENAKLYNSTMIDELHRVMIHGVLHYCGYPDKTKEEKVLMRRKEDYYLSLRAFN